MPVFKIFTEKNSKIGIWKLIEPPEKLEPQIFSLLTETEKKKYKTFKSISRRREWLATRILLQEMRKSAFYTPIQYGETCKPFLQNEYIGISHSRSFVAIITSLKSDVAIDIEKISPKAVRISQKFMNEQEKKFFSDVSEFDMTLLWSIKETVYKFYGRKELSFKDKIIVSKRIDANHYLVMLKNKPVDVFVKIIEDNVMTYIPA